MFSLDKWRQHAKRSSGSFLAPLLVSCVLPPLVPPLYLHPSHLSSRCSSSDALTHFHRIVIVAYVVLWCFCAHTNFQVNIREVAILLTNNYISKATLNIHGKVYAPSVHKVTKVTPSGVK